MHEDQASIFEKKLPKMSIVPATNTAEKNKTRYLLRVLKAGSSGIIYKSLKMYLIWSKIKL